MTRRSAVAAAFGIVPLLLAAGCGSSSGDGARSTISPIQPSSYVTIEPATTTTTTTIPAGQVIAGGISPTEQTYTVVAGDSLSKIASLYDITMDVLINYNGWTDGTNHFLGVGDKILIPPDTPIPGASGSTSGDIAAGDTSGDTGTATSETASGTDCPTTYVIAAGDTSRIKVAAKFDITYEQMDAANVGTPGYSSFVVGTSITIPCP